MSLKSINNEDGCLSKLRTVEKLFYHYFIVIFDSFGCFPATLSLLHSHSPLKKIRFRIDLSFFSKLNKVISCGNEKVHFLSISVRREFRCNFLVKQMKYVEIYKFSSETSRLEMCQERTINLKKFKSLF